MRIETIVIHIQNSEEVQIPEYGDQTPLDARLLFVDIAYHLASSGQTQPILPPGISQVTPHIKIYVLHSCVFRNHSYSGKLIYYRL